MSNAPVTPDHLLQLGLGFWGSRTLLSAIEMGLFSELAKGPRTLEEIQRSMGLHPRSARDFLDALVALRVLERQGDSGAGATYRNTAESDLFLDRAKPTYVGGMLEMAAARLYGFWGSLTEALRTGEPQNEIASGGGLFEELYSNPERLRSFLGGMTGISLGAAKAIAAKFPWKNYKSFADIGAAQGSVPVQLALAHPHLSGIGFDLPVVEPVFEEYVASFHLQSRVKFVGGDMFKGPWPAADVYILGHILHDWSLEQKKTLLAKAFAALPKGGAVIVYEALIDDERRTNAFGLLMSLNMLIETREGFDYSGADCQGWMREAGFTQTRVEHLVGPDSMVVGIK